MMNSLFMCPFICVYLLPVTQTADLVYNRYIRQTISGIIDQDTIIGTSEVTKRIQCAILCSQLEDCILYSVSLLPPMGTHRCQFSGHIVWVSEASEGAAIYKNAYREAPDEATTLVPCVCHNGGTCTYVGTSPQCACPQIYEGAQCETQITEAPDEATTLVPCVCHNGGTCTYVGTSPQCACPQMYEGAQCGTQITECSDPPSSGISTTNSYHQLNIINDASDKIHVYRKGSSELIQAISEGGGEWSTDDIKVGSRIYFMNEDENAYIPMQSSDGTWYCWIDLPSNPETLTAKDSWN